MRVEKIGSATLYLGDCFKVLPYLDPLETVITDPPYGTYENGGKWGKKNELKKWDRETPDITPFLKARNLAIWGGNYFQLPSSRGWLTWFKPDRVPSAADFEMCWTNLDMNARQISQSIAATNAERVGHPTQKPVRVMEWTLSFFPAASSILDPFMGSGSTGVACIKHGLKFTGIEIDKRYFEMACERIHGAHAQGRLFT